MEFRNSEISEPGQMILAVARIALGWIMLWSFFDKLFGLGLETPAGCGWIDGYSPSSSVVYVTKGVFADFFTSLGGNVAVDVLLMAGLLGVGVTLIFGFASKISTLAICAFMVVMYLLVVPPKDNPFVDYHVVYILTALAVYFCGGFRKLSVDSWWKGTWLVRRFPILS